MITRSQIKFIKSLSLKKNRYLHKCFIVEGEKNILELINSEYEILHLYLTEAIDINTGSLQVNFISKNELARISCLTSPNKALAVVKIPALKDLSTGSVLVLDSISDPGNLGTIIRLCDWFGVKKVVCSEDTVDVYNPKVVQASMGSIFRLDVLYSDLEKYLKEVEGPVFGSFINGEDIKKLNIPSSDFHLILGNESSGISKKIEKLITNRISITNKGSRAESLNVATAAAILLHEFCN